MKRLRDDNYKPIRNVNKKPNDALDEKIFEDDFIPFYWIDIYEDEIEKRGRIYMFGKIYIKSTNEYKNCVIGIDGNVRKIYVYPKYSTQDYIENVINEITSVRIQNKIHSTANTPFKMKIVDRQYCFEKEEVPHGINKFIKCVYPYSLPRIDNSNLVGEHYSYIFGTLTKPIENFLIKKKIMGPCWLKIKCGNISNNSLSRSSKKTLCFAELLVNNPSDVITLSDNDIYKFNLISTPHIIVSSIALQINKNNNIMGISCVTNNKMPLQGEEEIKEEKYNTKIFIKEQHNQKNQLNDTIFNINKENTEYSLISNFLTHIKEIDPDVIIGHNIENDINNIITRMKNCNIFNNFYIGRFDHNNTKIYNSYTTGRLICDTLQSIQDIYKSKDYSLSYLTKLLFNTDIKEIEEITNNEYNSKEICTNLYNNSLFSLKLLQKFNILPLTKYLTSICGNTWKKSLANARAERIEYLIMHKFYEEKPKFILPDKKEYLKGSEKSKYKGGLVLTPSIGLYDSMVVLLDFKSLYPSIILESNICFTTINNIKKNGILPTIVKSLISQRNKIKDESKTNSINKLNLDIQQLAVKLVTNSIYGCLGYKNSRFYNLKLAETITDKGREILTNTKDFISKKYNIIYGDTDSIMIDTKQKDLKNAITIGNNIKESVNTQYKHIEFEIDKIYEKLLLLSKKKYTGKIVNNDNIEIKGLDIVRRDWCDISCDLGKSIIDMLFSSNYNSLCVKEFIMEELKTIVNNNNIPLEKFKKIRRLWQYNFNIISYKNCTKNEE